MTIRFGLGPVFAFEWLIASRRWQMYAARSLYVLMLLAGLFFIWKTDLSTRSYGSAAIKRSAAGEALFTVTIGLQLAIVMFAAPVGAAGAICDEKARSTLLHLAVTEVSSAEIVIGKLAARLPQAIGMASASLPMLLISTLLGEIEPDALVGAVSVTIVVAVFGCSVALACSVWATRAYEAIIAVYSMWALVLCVNPVAVTLMAYLKMGPPPVWLRYANPFALAFAPYSGPARPGMEVYVAYCGAILAIAVCFLAVAIARVRAVTVTAIAPAKEARRRSIWARVSGVVSWLLGPSLDANPMLWREWHRKQPSRWVRVVWLIFLSVMAGLLAISIHEANYARIVQVNAFFVAIGLFLLSVSSVTRLADDLNSTEMLTLLTTPLSTSEIVWAKWWLIFRRMLALGLLPIGLGLFLAQSFRQWIEAPWLDLSLPAYCAVLASLILTAATWVRRRGRAAVLCVTVYLLATIGLFLVTAIFRGRELAEGVGCGSPYFGTAVVTGMLCGRPPNYWKVEEWKTFWILVYAGLGFVLYMSVRTTFERCVGRMSSEIAKPVLQPTHDSMMRKPAAAELPSHSW